MKYPRTEEEAIAFDLRDARKIIEQQQATIARLSAQALSESEEKTFAEYAWDEAFALVIAERQSWEGLNAE